MSNTLHQKHGHEEYGRAYRHAVELARAVLPVEAEA